MVDLRYCKSFGVRLVAQVIGHGWVVAIATGLAMGTGGCGSDDGRAAVPSDLRGRLYVAVDANQHELVEDREATVLVGDEVIDASGGCNPDNTVAYTLDRGKLRVLPYFASDSFGTGCRDDIERQDAWLHTLLRSSPTVRLKDSGATLILGTSDDTVTFAARARPEVRRTIPRGDLDRFHLSVEAARGAAESGLAELDRQVQAGTVSRRQGRAAKNRLVERFSRDHRTAVAEAKASAR